MAKKIIIVLAAFLIVRGFLSLIPDITWAAQAQWVGIVEIVLGLVALGFSNLKRS